MILRIIVFLVINFTALGIGGLATRVGVPSHWYENLNKAPWTPPDWAFGAAWTAIMVCFAIYMAILWPLIENKKLIIALFIIQLVLNIAWNPIFFHFHQIGMGLTTISLLTILIGYIFITFYSVLKMNSILIAPYFIWLVIATSLNAYVLIYN